MNEFPNHAFCRETFLTDNSTVTLDSLRLDKLKDIASDICNTQKEEIYMENGLTELNSDFLQEFRTSNKHIFSGVMVDQRNALKSQLHVPVDQSNMPNWYNKLFAETIKPAVLEGYVVFDYLQLNEALINLLGKYDNLRVKLGIGRGGTDQIVVDKSILETNWYPWTLAEIKQGGIVVEENVENQAESFSFSSLDFPCQSRPLVSVGVIVQRDLIDNQRVYVGTTCVVFDQNTLDDNNHTPHDDVTIDDPIFGKLTIRGNDVKTIAAAGIWVAEAYRDSFIAVLPRINLDFIQRTTNATDEYKVIDPSLRIGGNSWSELWAIKRFKDQPNLTTAVHSVRIVYTKEDKEKYITAWENCEVLCETPEDSALWYSVLVCVHS